MPVALILIAVGLLLIVFDNLFVKKISSPFLRPVLIFWDAYNFASGLMSTSLSYLRLFALGLAGGLLGAAFNQIAFMLITNEQGVVNWATPLVVFTILILIIGHSLNLALSALGAFVHPLRLTFVEFYGGFSLGFKGGGKPYKPLSKVTETE
jgi:V/A-type H+-transporting ATPase subunit I